MNIFYYYRPLTTKIFAFEIVNWIVKHIAFFSGLAKAKTGLQTAGMIITEARAMWSRNSAEDIVKTHQIPYHCTLAASYSNLTSAVIKAMDDELQVSGN